MSNPDVITVAYRQVQGNAKNYQYWGAKRYGSSIRQKDGLLTYRPSYIIGADRRSYRLATMDAQKAAAELGLPFVENVRLGTLVHIS